MLGVEHTYYYDANGNITSEIIVDGNNTEYKTYLYDSQNRMTRYNDSALDLTIVYTYDNRGNILNYTMYEYSAYTNPVNESTADSYNYAYANATWKDLATTVMGESITYDAIGNPLKWQGHKRLTWANGRQLTRARASTFGTTFDVYYSYDGDGLRTGKSGTRNTEYIILGGTYIGERTTINGTEYLITYIYDADGSILGIDINGTAYYFVKNLQGDVTAMVTEFGEIIGKYTYDAYGYCYPVKDASGNTITDETHPAKLNPFRYRGYYYDVETKFYYLNTRYYDPEACRFINADGLASTGQGFDGNNMFAYCGNNPIIRYDANGKSWNPIKDILKKTIEIAETTINVIKDLKNFDIDNESEENVLKSNYISAYKGKLVFRTDGERSGSFGALFITRETNNRLNPEDVIKHEYGHTKQLDELGVLNYALFIGIPSWLELSDQPYYERPWEVTADYYGGVTSRNPSEEILNNGFNYLNYIRPPKLHLYIESIDNWFASE